MQKVALRIKSIIKETQNYRTAVKALFKDSQFLNNTSSIKKIPQVTELVEYIHQQPSHNDDFWREKLLANLSSYQDSQHIDNTSYDKVEIEMLNKPQLLKIIRSLRSLEDKRGWGQFFIRNIDKIPVSWYTAILELPSNHLDSPILHQMIQDRVFALGNRIPSDIISCIMKRSSGRIEQGREANLRGYESGQMKPEQFLINLSYCRILNNVQINHAQKLIDSCKFGEGSIRAITQLALKFPIAFNQDAKDIILKYFEENPRFTRHSFIFFVKAEVYELGRWERLASQLEFKCQPSFIKLLVSITELEKMPDDIVKQWLRIIWIVLIKHKETPRNATIMYLHEFYTKHQQFFKSRNISPVKFNLLIDRSSWQMLFPTFDVKRQPQAKGLELSLKMTPEEFNEQLRLISKLRSFTQDQVQIVRQFLKRIDDFNLHNLIKLKSQILKIYDQLPENTNDVIVNRVQQKLGSQSLPPSSIYPFVRYFGVQNVDTDLFCLIESKIISNISFLSNFTFSNIITALKKSNRLSPRLIKATFDEIIKRTWDEQMVKIIRTMSDCDINFSYLEPKILEILPRSSQALVLDCAATIYLLLAEKREGVMPDIKIEVVGVSDAPNYDILLAFHGHKPFSIDQIQTINSRYPISGSKSAKFIKLLNQNLKNINYNQISNFLYLLPDFDAEKVQLNMRPLSCRQYLLLALALHKKKKVHMDMLLRHSIKLSRPHPTMEEYYELGKVMRELPTKIQDYIEVVMLRFISNKRDLLKLLIDLDGKLSVRIHEQFKS